MSNTEEALVTVALNCSVKVSGTLYAPNDVIRVPEDIARRLITQKAADAYSLEQEQPLPEQPEGESGDPILENGVEAEDSDPENEGETATPAPKARDSKGKSGKPATEQAAA
jgi:hypothetical protein